MTMCICCRKEVSAVAPTSTRLMVWPDADGRPFRDLSLVLKMRLGDTQGFDVDVCQTCYNKFLKVAEVAAGRHIEEQERLSKDKRVARIRELKDEIAALEKKG